MKEIKAIIQPYMLESVCDALEKIEGLPGLTLSHVLGFGKTRAAEATEAAVEAGRSLAKKVKLEIVVTDEMASLIVTTIARAARTGKAGDGKVFVYEVLNVVKIRTGEQGSSAV